MTDLKALIVILGLSLPVFWIARAPACEIAVEAADFSRRRNLWIAITLLAFVSHSFWVYVVGASLLLMFGAQREPNRLALYLALIMAVPMFSQTIPGFGGIQQIISLNHVRLLSIVLLLPAYMLIRRQPGVLPFGRTMADKCLLGYLALQVVLQVSVASITGIARYAIYSFTDVFLPYYVASRGLRDLRAFRDALTTMVLTVVLMAPVAVFEYFRHWLLYNGLADAMGVIDKMGSYLTRGDNLRAVVTSEHSIVLGYLSAAALGLFVYVSRFISRRAIRALGLGMLVATLIASGARGPWVGAVVVLFVVLLTSPEKFTGTVRLTLLAAPVLVALSLTEFGQRLFELLPFVGSASTESVDYRQRLFEVSVLVIGQHPWFGAFDYLVNPSMQELIQGEGIIDVVNSYLGVALTFGIVGLSLFCGVFGFAGWGVWVMLRRSEPHSELSLLGRALLATLAGILVTILTVSSIGVIPSIYWVVAGLCVAYAQLVPNPAATANKALGHRQPAGA
jgi:O-antigen ligase